MIQFTTPENLNGAELIKELNDDGVEVTGNPFLDANNDLWLDISESDKTKAKSIVAAHNGTVTAPDNTAARQALLTRLGITADEAKLLLGGN
jgi:hypothetical protein